MKPSVPPHMVALLVLTSLTPVIAENVAIPTAPTSSDSAQPFAPLTRSQIAAAFKASTPIPRARPVAPRIAKAKSGTPADVRREPVSFHPITIKNGPQPYVVDPDGLRKGLALISGLYRKAGSR